MGSRNFPFSILKTRRCSWYGSPACGTWRVAWNGWRRTRRCAPRTKRTRSSAQQYAQELRDDARRHADAIWLLRRAIRRWPVHAATYYTHAACGLEHLPRAEQLLQEARDKAPPGAWLRTAAHVAACGSRLSEALECWNKVLQIQPLAIDAHRAVAQLLSETQGREAALEHLGQAANQFPHLRPLQELRVEWLREEPPEVREAAIRQAMVVEPNDAYLHRELALVLSVQCRFEDAWQELGLAGQLEPQHLSYFLVRAHVLGCQNRIEEAKQDFRQVVAISVDNDLAISGWIDLCETIDERRQVLEFIKDQLVRQVIFGDGLLAFRAHARLSLEAAEVLALLEDAWRARPDLWRTWSALIGQQLDMNRVDQAWELACQATDRFPLVAPLWLARAELSRVRGDSEGEQQTLETACQIAPNWGDAVQALSDLYERRGDDVGSQRLLERYLGRNPLDAIRRLRLAGVQWQRGEHDAALEGAQRAVREAPAFEPAWDCLRAWSREQGRPDRALQMARELTERRGSEARSWLRLARLLDEAGQQAERLAALDRAIQLEPRNVEAHDLRAVTLAAAGRWDEALTACLPAVWQDRPPAWLRFRAAWIAAQRGDLPEAIERMRQVVHAEPYFYEAWSQLAEWCDQARQPAASLEAAEVLVQLRPHSEISFGYLGTARLAGNRTGAMRAFERALELNPRYQYAGCRLFDLHLASGQLAEAEAILARFRHHTAGQPLAACRVQLAVRRSDERTARAALQEICLACVPDSTPLNIAVQSMYEAGWESPAAEVMEAIVDTGSAHTNVLACWAYLQGLRLDHSCVPRLRKLVKHDDRGRTAPGDFIRGLLDKGADSLALNFVQQNAFWLRKYTPTWGAGGYALTRLGRYREAVEWNADWRDRQDAEPWMLVNVAESLRALGRDVEAAEASHRALALPTGEGQALHRLWLAIDAACEGDIATARERFSQVQPESLRPVDRFDWTLVASVIQMADAPSEARARVFAEVRRRLADAEAEAPQFASRAALKRAYRRCLAQIARSRGTLAARLWYLYQWLLSW